MARFKQNRIIVAGGGGGGGDDTNTSNGENGGVGGGATGGAGWFGGIVNQLASWCGQGRTQIAGGLQEFDSMPCLHCW